MRNVLVALAFASLVAIVTPLPARAQTAPTPTVQSFAPTSITAGSLTIGNPLTVVVTGTGFTSKTTATLSAPAITAREIPIAVDATGTHASLTVRVPLLEQPTKLTIVLANPPPAKSVSIVFTVTAPPPTPTVQSFAPTSIPAGQLTIGHPLTVVVTGTGLTPQTTATLSSPAFTAREIPITVDATGTHASLTVRVPLLEMPGNLTIVLANPAPAKSASIVFAVTAPAPVELARATPSPIAPTPAPVRTATPAPTPTPPPFVPPTVGFQFGPSPSPTPVRTPPPQVAIQATNGVPLLTSMSPTTASAGGGNVTLTLSGNNFSAASSVSVGSYTASPISSTSTSLSVLIPANVLTTPGTVSVSVSNPPPGGGTSAPLSFNVTAALNPAPAIISMTPTSVRNASGATTVTVTATGLMSSTSATLAGVPGAISGSTITFNLPAAAIANPGTLSGLIANPQPGGGTASFSLSVLNAAPTVSAFAPTSARAGASAVALSVSGSGFTPTSVVTFAGTPVPTTFVSSTTLNATLTSAMLQGAGTLPVGVSNPAPGGGSAAAPGGFSITNAVPTVSALSPAAVNAGSATAVTISVTGTGFSGSSTASISGGLTAAASTQLATVFVSPTSLTVTIPASLLPLATVLSVAVTNSPPGGGTSGSVSLQVTNPAPVLQGVSPAAFSASASNATLTVTGSNFVQGATVSIGGTALATTYVSRTQLTAVLPAPYPTGNLTVTVTNPTPGGGASNGISIVISPPLP